VARVSDNIVELLLLVDGQRTVTELAAELGRRQGRFVHPAEVGYLLRRRLAPAGLVRIRWGSITQARREATEAAQPKAGVMGEASVMPVAVDPTVATQAASSAQAVQLAEPDPITHPLPPPHTPGAGAYDDDRFAGKFLPILEDEVETAILGQLDEPSEGTAPPVVASPASAALALADDDSPTSVIRQSQARGTDREEREMSHLRAMGRQAPTSRRRSVWIRLGVAIAALGRGLLALVGIALLVLAVTLAIHSTQLRLGQALTPPASAPTATPSPPQARILPGETAYIVRPGDTLASIAAQVHISVQALLLVNGAVLPTAGRLVPGMRLAIPASYRPGVLAAQQPRPLYYIVRPGDTLYGIGQRFGVDWQVIATYNGIGDEHDLAVDQGLVIPAGS
jgi:LysM repeat protein